MLNFEALNDPVKTYQQNQISNKLKNITKLLVKKLSLDNVEIAQTVELDNSIIYLNYCVSHSFILKLFNIFALFKFFFLFLISTQHRKISRRFIIIIIFTIPSDKRQQKFSSSLLP